MTYGVSRKKKKVTRQGSPKKIPFIGFVFMWREFRLALKSRTLERLTMEDLYRHGSRTASFFLAKSLADATVITEAMKSRGFFND